MVVLIDNVDYSQATISLFKCHLRNRFEQIIKVRCDHLWLHLNSTVVQLLTSNGTADRTLPPLYRFLVGGVLQFLFKF